MHSSTQLKIENKFKINYKFNASAKKKLFFFKDKFDSIFNHDLIMIQRNAGFFYVY